MRKNPPTNNGSVTLKQLAQHLGLDPTTVSVVLNEVPGRAIPQVTRDRIKAAARKFNYRPSLLARSLRNRKTQTIGILAPELSDGYHTQVMSGIGDHLMAAGYFYFTAHHRHRKTLIDEYIEMLLGRGVEGLIAIDTALERSLPVPAACVAGHRVVEGVTNVVLDHRFAAELTLSHLQSLGHRRIAFMRGQPFSSDSDERWTSICQTAETMGVTIDPDLVVELTRDVSSPELGYPVVQALLAVGKKFTAIVAFNDMSAIGTIRALEDLGLRVPEDVSVIGFDDITAASFNNPRLTTIRQPLSNMGRIAAQSVLNRIHQTEQFRKEVTVEPELVVRESTAGVRTTKRSQDSKDSKPNQYSGKRG
jgi:DNA-binding LacI/PurR family transcriptional regulator